MTAGMSPERREFMRNQADVFSVPRGMKLPEVVAFTLRSRLPLAQARTEIAYFMNSYTGTFQVNGRIEIYCFVGEENLTAASEWDENELFAQSGEIRFGVHQSAPYAKGFDTREAAYMPPRTSAPPAMLQAVIGSPCRPTPSSTPTTG